MERFAFDLRSVRSKDQDGRLHVSTAHISKGNVCPYLGSEIPGADALGLKPDRIYRLWRHPDELAKAVATANNLPILSKHVPVSPDAPRKDLVIGSTGTDASFDDPYLDNSLVFWDGDAIGDIEAERKRELSCAYRYTADMTPGEVDGEPYDGIMRDIKFNHLALVPEGRAGSDVMVGDQALPPTTEIQLDMPNRARLTRKALMARGALAASIGPKLAQDATLDYSALVSGATAKNWSQAKVTILDRVRKATAGKLATDATLDDVTGLLDRLDKEGEGEPDTQDAEMDDDREDDRDDKKEPRDEPEKKVEDEDPAEKIEAWLREKLGPEDLEELQRMTDAAAAGDKRGRDAEPDKKAMDAAIAKTAAETEARVVARMNAVAEAQRAVRPHVGDVFGQDTAAGVYKIALDHLGVEAKDVPAEGLRALFVATVKAQTPQRRMAADAATGKSFAEMFPNAARVHVLGGK